MGSATLVEDKIRAGKTLVTALDQAGFEVKSAFWLHSADDDTWQLVIASPIIGTIGPKQSYSRLHSLLSGIPLSSSEVSLVKNTEPIVELLRTAIKTEPTGTSEIRFKGNTVNGVLIDDAVIYRST